MTPPIPTGVGIAAERSVAKHMLRGRRYIVEHEEELRRLFGEDNLAVKVGDNYAEVIAHDADGARLSAKTKDINIGYGETIIYTTIAKAKRMFEALEAQQQR
jgi:hypothetical protein